MNRLLARLLEAALRNRAVWRVLGRGRMRFETQVVAARVLRWLELRRDERVDLSLPGRALLDANWKALARLGPRLAHGSVVVTATNGKTTTTRMLAAIVEAAGFDVVANRGGANMIGAVTAELVGAARRRGRMAGDIGVFEVDEQYLDAVAGDLRPRVISFGNLFRDQPDRHPELADITDAWTRLVRGLPAGSTVAVCADDPRTAALGRTADASGVRVVRFGIDDRSLGSDGPGPAADMPWCDRCGEPLRYDVVFAGHLGHYACTSCGAARPPADVRADDVELLGWSGSTFTLHVPDGSAPVRLAVPGAFNVANAVAAAAVAWPLGIPLDVITGALGTTTSARGRTEVAEIDGTRVHFLLVKNPVSASEVFRLLAGEAGDRRLDLLYLVSGGPVLSRDVSWLWDAEVERVAAVVRRVTCAGSRASHAALRLKYAGVDTARITVADGVVDAFDAALARSDGDLYVVAGFSGMVELRDVLADRGVAPRFWA